MFGINNENLNAANSFNICNQSITTFKLPSIIIILWNQSIMKFPLIKTVSVQQRTTAGADRLKCPT